MQATKPIQVERQVEHQVERRVERKRAGAVLEAHIASPVRPKSRKRAGVRRSSAEAALTHDSRNMVTALVLYCDLLEQPGVLASGFEHYAQELRLVADASRRLIEKHGKLQGEVFGFQDRVYGLEGESYGLQDEAFGASATSRRRAVPVFQDASTEDGSNRDSLKGCVEHWITDLARELEANRNLLDAIAGLGVSVSLAVTGGASAVGMSAEDLTRLLINLVKNAAEEMRGAGRVRIELKEHGESNGACAWLLLTVEDSGPGIPAARRETVFTPGYSTHPLSGGGWAGAHRGLGLSISRSLVEAAGGTMRAVQAAGGGARFEIELPVRP